MARKAKKIKNCPNCDCEGTIKPSIARGFQRCIECKHIVATRKIKKVVNKEFGLANKSLEQAIKKLEDFRKLVPEGASAKIQPSYSWSGSSNYKFVVEKEESDEEVLDRMLKAEAKERERQEKAERERKAKAERDKKLAKQREHQLKQKELQNKRRLEAEKRRKEKEEKLDAFFKQHGLSIKEVKEVLNG